MAFPLEHIPWNKGKHHTIESNDKNRRAHLGKIPWNKGGHHKPESNEKNRLAHLGKRHTIESRTKMSRENHPRWMGGTRELNKIVRDLPENDAWKVSVFILGDRECLWCGYHGRDIQADHIIPLTELLSKYKITTREEAILCPQLWDVSNGRVLCIPCHIERHRLDKKI